MNKISLEKIKMIKFNSNHSVFRRLSTSYSSSYFSQEKIQDIDKINKEKQRKLIRGIIQKIMPFNTYLASSQSVSYSFTENERKNFIKEQKIASDLLVLSFLNLGCLISKPAFKFFNGSLSPQSSQRREGKSLNGLEQQRQVKPINPTDQKKTTQVMKSELLQHKSEENIMSIENSYDIINGKKKWVIRLFFYIRNPFKCYNNKFSRNIKQNIMDTKKKSNHILKQEPNLLNLTNMQPNINEERDRQIKLTNNLDSLNLILANNLDNLNLSKKKHFKNNKGYAGKEILTNINPDSQIIEFNFLEIYRSNITSLVKELSNIFKTDIELEIIQLKKSYNNSNILAQHLHLRSYKYRFVQLINKFLSRFSFIRKTRGKNAAPTDNIYLASKISGVKIKLGGRTFKQNIIPRRTVQQIQRGSLARDKVKLVEKSRVTGKTRRGAYSFTVSLGHVFV